MIHGLRVIIGVAMDIETGNGYTMGYIVTMTILKRQDLTLWNVNLGYDVFTVIRQRVEYNSDLEAICHNLAVIVDSKVLEMHRQIKRLAEEAAEKFMNELDK